VARSIIDGIKLSPWFEMWFYGKLGEGCRRELLADFAPELEQLETLTKFDSLVQTSHFEKCTVTQHLRETRYALIKMRVSSGNMEGWKLSFRFQSMEP